MNRKEGQTKSTSYADAAGTQLSELFVLCNRLVERAQASGADVGLYLLTIENDGLLMRVNVPLTVGAPLGVAHVMSELYCFPTYVTFAWHRIPFDQIVVLR